MKSPRFQDTASAYRLHRGITNEAQAISAQINRCAAGDLELHRDRIRVLDAGTGDGWVLKGVLETLLPCHRGCPFDVVLKEYDFHHIEILLQNVAPMLRCWPQLALFVTNRVFRRLQGFPEDLCLENTVSFDDVAGYRLQAMAGTASLLHQENSPLHSFPQLEAPLSKATGKAGNSFMPFSELWDTASVLLLNEPFGTIKAGLISLGDEIRAREIYDELAATGVRDKHFTLTVARQERHGFGFTELSEFFWDLAIVSHAFNRDKDPAWICKYILSPLAGGLATGGILVNIQATDGGHMGEIKREIFNDSFSFNATPRRLVEALESGLDSEEFHLMAPQEFAYHGLITSEVFASLEPWERALALHRMAISVAYHLQIPEEVWLSNGPALERKIQQLLERDGELKYVLAVTGIKRPG